MISCPQPAPPVLSVEEGGLPDSAAWVWLALLGLLIGFELWATLTDRPTLSDWLRKYRGQRRWRWLSWLIGGSLLFLIYHLLWQGHC